MIAKIKYRLQHRGREITSEVICLKHYAAVSQPSGYMGPLSQNEKARGYEQTATAYTGNRPCALCQEEAEQKGTAA